MKKTILSIAFLFPNIVFANTYIEKTFNGHYMKVIKYDLSSDIYDLKVVKTDDASELGELLKENNAITGINGVFFCPTDYDWCNTDKSFTDNERYIEGEKYATYLTTGDRAVFGWTEDKEPFIYQSGKINMNLEGEIYYGLGNYPLLLHEGKNMLEEYRDKGLIDGKMTVKTTRNFVCSDEKKENIYFGLLYNATIDETASILKQFGCYDALNLDAGLSTSFVYNNKYIVGPPKRKILDGLAVVRKGLNLQKITNIGENVTDYIVSSIEKKYKNKNKKKLALLKKYINSFNELRREIYDKYSTDIIEKNTLVGEMEKIGYQIEINDLKTLKLLILVNEILDNLSIIEEELNEEIQEENEINEIEDIFKLLEIEDE